MTKTLKCKLSYFIRFILSTILCCYISSCNTAENETESAKEDIPSNNCDSNIIPFRNDTSISDSNGIAKNVDFLLPKEFLNDSDKVNDSVFFLWTTNCLKELKEPVLYNSFLKKDIFRLTLGGYMSLTKVIRLEKDKNLTYVIVKQLNSLDLFFYSIRNPNIGLTFNHYTDTLLITNKEWGQYYNSTYKSNFYCLKNVLRRKTQICDGGVYCLEAHNKNGYYVVKAVDPIKYDYIEYSNLVAKLYNLAQPVLNNFYFIDMIKKNRSYISSGQDFNQVNIIEDFFDNSEFNSNQLIKRKIEEFKKLKVNYQRPHDTIFKTKISDSLCLKLEEIIEIIKPYEQKILKAENLFNY